ncbi:hypothetical protein [Micromonospora cathayae]|uniref:Uncharacterized protein n=1 Tax=Micromonospora cathayae TaxID=3028804 RepID=A0ABY7ZW88_9ACTN|nr:hypothetical protein [Micromonospora sp. HUAS 3]WDZ87180.1 hypothetical protein PVK37_12630 [Micromonospora sp. HUAS 3]
MTVLVDVGLTAGAADTSGYWHIGDPVRGRIGTATLAPDGLMLDCSGRLMALSVQRTSTRRAGPLVEHNAGTATITLLNNDGLLDPAVLGQPAPGAEIRIRKRHGDITYPVFRGYVKSWLPEHRHPDHAVVVVTATDGMELLANTDRVAVAAVGEGETTGARIGRILDSVGWPATDRSIMTGDSTVQATTLEGSALQEIQRVVTAEAGQFFVDQQGNAVFTSRRLVLQTDLGATFGSNRAGGEIPYVGRPGMSYDREQLVNRVRATRAGGVEQVVSDPTSVARYRESTHTETDLLLQTDADVQSWARHIVYIDKEPEFRFTSLTLDARVDPTLIYPLVLGMQFGSRITVVRRPPGGIVDSREVIVRSVEHEWSPPDRWITTWGLQAADRFAFWTIGHPTRGRIGSNGIAF